MRQLTAATFPYSNPILPMLAEDFVAEIQRGDTLRDQGLLESAFDVYQSCIDAFPERHLGHYKLGTALMRANRTQEAEACFRKSLTLAPDHAESANNLALLLTGKGEYGEAEAIYRAVLADKPDFPEGNLNLGDILYITRRLSEAIYFYRRALALRPNWPLALMQLAQVLLDSGRSDDAVLYSEAATSQDPDLANAWINYGRCLLNHGEPERARTMFERAIELAPGIIAAWHNWLLSANYLGLPKEQVQLDHARFGRYMADNYRRIPGDFEQIVPNPNRTIRLGIVSGDLRRHSVSYFVEGLLRNLDPRKIEIWVYYTYHGEDYRSAELKPLVHKWRQVFSSSDSDIADRIAGDAIDILFDLSGHTGHGRLAVFAMKPAPIQVSWIGYPNTTGLETMDFRITDALADPPGESDRYCSESLLRLPGCFLSYTPPNEAPSVAPPPHLAQGIIAFGSFNAISKIGTETISLWSKVLAEVPGSILILKAADAFNREERCNRVLRSMESAGIDPKRIRLLPWEPDVGRHLALYDQIDICLDTIPYNGTTTTCEALWMGVPVVCMEGDRHAARVGASLLSAAGLPELVARNADEFVNISSTLAADSGRLCELRRTMRERLIHSTLLDARRASRDLEVVLREIWQNWCGRQNPTAQAESPGQPIQTTAATGIDDVARLHLGGKEARAGWQILNIQPGPNVDYVGDIRDLQRFEDESFGEIYASHVLEHLNQQDFPKALKEIQRILSPGGRLYISVPDMDALCRAFLDPAYDINKKFHVMRILFGGQSDPFDYHQIGLNIDFMVHFLQLAGFYSVEQVESFDLFNDDSTITPLGTPISLNLIAVK